MFDKPPRVVLRAEQVADVIAGVNFARENSLDLSVRGEQAIKPFRDLAPVGAEHVGPVRMPR